MPPVIDIHEHVRTRDHFRQGREALTTCESLVETMDRLGIDQMVVLPLATPETFAVVQSCEEVFEACDRHPGRFIKFCNADPRLSNNNPEYEFVPLLEYFKDLGAKGLGEMTSNLWFDDPRVHNLFSACEKTGLPAIFHVAVREFAIYGLIDMPGLPGLERALKKFPNLPFLGHSQAFWSEVSPVKDPERGGYPEGPVKPGGAVPRLMRENPNLWGDMSAGSGCNAVSRDPEWGYQFIDEFQDRLLYANDFCVPGNCNESKLMDFLKDGLAKGKISQVAFDKLMGENAIRLLGL